jgi:DNA-binding NarL/FixJ family response regulator
LPHDGRGAPRIVGLAGRAAETKPPTGHPAIDSLSEREREVLMLIAGGNTNRQMAERLHVSVKTIESYRARLMTKLGLANRAELTQLAIDSGLLAKEA